EAVTIRPTRTPGIVAQDIPEIKGGHDLDRRKRATGMTALRLGQHLYDVSPKHGRPVSKSLVGEAIPLPCRRSFPHASPDSDVGPESLQPSNLALERRSRYSAVRRRTEPWFRGRVQTPCRDSTGVALDD